MNRSPFVVHASLGLGRRAGAYVRYFDSPAANEVVMPVADGVKGPVVLPPQQRVWWHDGSRWLAGFVDSRAEESGLSYWVNFPNRRTVQVPADALRVRWSVPLSDPVGMLKFGTVESRFLHSARIRFVRSVLDQRAASDGLAGVWSSAVSFYAHQIGVARQVLTDPVRRYLLADEVGLGKTIEAGLVVRQSLMESHGHVLVLAPAGLLEQWRGELEAKFGIEQFGDRVRIAAHDEIQNLQPEARLLTVVDEAHLLTASSGGDREVPYEALRAMAHASQGLLLLSATPVRSNEDGFLRMLHLLDPASYDLDQVEEFRKRVAMRDELAGALAALSDDMPLLFFDEPIGTLRELLPAEAWLQEELDHLAVEIETVDEEAARERSRKVRLRLSETHRIHRRMIRTRRGTALAKTFPVRGRTRADEWLLVDKDPRRASVLAFLEEARGELEGAEDVDAAEVFRTLLGRALGPVVSLVDLARALRGEADHDLDEVESRALRALAGGVAGAVWADRLDAIIGVEADADRFMAMCAWVWQHIGHAQVVVACSFPNTADAAARELEANFGVHRVVRLIAGMGQGQRAEAIHSFTTDPSRTVLVMDRSAEEGVNLQVALAVLHLDLPVGASRIEQRLGRFDRYAAGGAIATTPVASMAFREASAELDAELGAWRRALDEGFDVFNQSSATLQYVLPEMEEAFIGDALADGLASAGRRVAGQRASVESQRRRIKAQDLLDAFDDHVDDEELHQRMVEADGAGVIREAFDGYAVDMLNFKDDYDGRAVRYGVSKKDPPHLTELEMGALGPGLLRTRYTYLRSDAGRGIRLLRWGDPLYDRLAAYAERDDRGRAFAVEVCQQRRPAGVPPLTFFCFDMLISPAFEAADEADDDRAAFSAAVRTRVHRYLPPRLERVWWSPDVEYVSVQDQRALEQASGGVNLGSRPDRFMEITGHMSWQDLCDRAAESAGRLVAQNPAVTSHLESGLRRARREEASEAALMAVRAGVGHHEMADPRLWDEVIAAVGNPVVAVEACGVVFVTSPEPDA